MRTIAHQSLLDISIQESGSVFSVLDWALKNNISITGNIEAGSILIDPESENADVEIKQYFSGKMIATNAESSNSAFDFGFGLSFQEAKSSDGYNVIANQSLFDISVESDGSVFSVVDWALKNNISVTTDLVAGQILMIPKSASRDNAVKNYFKNNRVKIATDIERQKIYLDFLFPNIFPLSL